jgi:hypothetical protein
LEVLNIRSRLIEVRILSRVSGIEYPAYLIEMLVQTKFGMVGDTGFEPVASCV